MTPPQGSDSRGDARLVDKVGAVHLAVSGHDLHGDAEKTLAMIRWLLDGENPEANSVMPATLFVEAIGVVLR